MNTVSIREAILRAADHIEANPGEFRFSSIRVPSGIGCGTPGCAIGWTAFFGGFDQTPIGFRKCVVALVGVDDGGEFYDRMTRISGEWSAWTRDANGCASALRLYADKYHPAPAPYPNWQQIAAQQTVPADAVDEMVRA